MLDWEVLACQKQGDQAGAAWEAGRRFGAFSSHCVHHGSTPASLHGPVSHRHQSAVRGR